MTTVTITRVEKIDELFCQYPGEIKPQPCYLALDTRDGELSCGYNPNIGNQISFDEYHGLILSAPISCLTADAANALMESVAPLAQQVLDGASEEWRNGNTVGVFTDAAAAAWERICEIAKAEYEDPAELVVARDVADWFTDGANATRSDLGITADTTDEQLAAMAKESSEEAATVGMYGYNVLDVDEVLAYLTGLRDDVRTELREDLADLVEQIDDLMASRDNLIRRLRGWGDSLRAVAALAGVSHTEVRRIATETPATEPVPLIQYSWVLDEFDDGGEWEHVASDDHIPAESAEALAQAVAHKHDVRSWGTPWRVKVWNDTAEDERLSDPTEGERMYEPEPDYVLTPEAAA